jgi:hypothetical protein
VSRPNADGPHVLAQQRRTMSISAQAHTVGPDEGRVVDLGVTRMRVLATGEATGGGFTLAEFAGTPGPWTAVRIRPSTPPELLSAPEGVGGARHHCPVLTAAERGGYRPAAARGQTAGRVHLAK